MVSRDGELVVQLKLPELEQVATNSLLVAFPLRFRFLHGGSP